MIIAITSLRLDASEDPEYLKELIVMANSSHPSITAIAASAQAFDSRKEISNYISDPTLKSNYFLNPLETRNGPQRYHVTLSQSLPWPSEVYSKQTQTQTQHDLTRRNLEIEQRDLALRVRLNVFRIIEQKLIKTLTSSILSSLDDFREIVLSQIEVNQATQSDVVKVNVETATLKQRLITINLDIAMAANKITELIGQKFSPGTLPSEFPKLYLQATPSRDLEKTLINHPQYQAALARIRYQEARRSEVESQSLPKIALNVSWMNIGEPDSKEMSTHPGKDAMSIGLAVSVPVWTLASSRTQSEIHLLSSRKAESHAIALSLIRKAKDLLLMLDSHRNTRALYEYHTIPNLQKTSTLTVKITRKVMDSRSYSATLQNLVKLVPRLFKQIVRSRPTIENSKTWVLLRR